MASRSQLIEAVARELCSIDAGDQGQHWDANSEAVLRDVDRENARRVLRVVVAYYKRKEPAGVAPERLEQEIRDQVAWEIRTQLHHVDGIGALFVERAARIAQAKDTKEGT